MNTLPEDLLLQEKHKPGEVEDFAEKIKELDEVIENFVGLPELHSSDAEARAEALKKRNALYSRRKYYRKKLKVEELERDQSSLLKKNSVLKKQNAILEDMIECAKNQVKIHEMLSTDSGSVSGIGSTTAKPSLEANPLLANTSASSIFPQRTLPLLPDLSQEQTLRRLLLGQNLPIGQQSLSTSGGTSLLSPIQMQPEIGSQNRGLLNSMHASAGLPLSPNLLAACSLRSFPLAPQVATDEASLLYALRMRQLDALEMQARALVGDASPCDISSSVAYGGLPFAGDGRDTSL